MVWEQSRVEKNDRNFPQRRQPTRIQSSNKLQRNDDQPKKGDHAKRYPYANCPMETALPWQTLSGMACRVGNVKRFPRGSSLANYWGLTPGCRNSGEKSQRLGNITKAGSSMARWLLAQVTINVLRKDARLREWFKRIKRKRGSKIARVAVMRKLATIIWHMLSKRKTYDECRAFKTT
jgi:Transposase IS116/IS110/IS902 family